MLQISSVGMWMVKVYVCKHVGGCAALMCEKTTVGVGIETTLMLGEENKLHLQVCRDLKASPGSNAYAFQQGRWCFIPRWSAYSFILYMAFLHRFIIPFTQAAATQNVSYSLCKELAEPTVLSYFDRRGWIGTLFTIITLTRQQFHVVTEILKIS